LLSCLKEGEDFVELDICLDANSALVPQKYTIALGNPILAEGDSAISTRSKLVGGSVVNPRLTSKGDRRKRIGRRVRSGPTFERSLTTQHTRRGAVANPTGSDESLAPVAMRHSCVKEKATNHFQDGTVHAFHHSILGRMVGHRQLTSGAALVDILGEGMAGVLAGVVHT
jgi:hypothetical protein